MSTLEHHLGEDLMAMADGGRDIDAARKRELEAHLSTCTECQEAIASARRVLRAVDEQALADPSPGFDRALFARLDALDVETAAGRASFIDRLRDFFTLPKIGWALAATAAASVVVAIAVSDRRPNDSAMAMELAQNLEGLRLADNLELYKNLEVIENLDVLDDIDAIQAMEEEPG